MKKGIQHARAGTPIDHYLLIKTATKQIASNHKPFLTLILGDQTGEIEAKLWGINEKDETTFCNKTMVHVRGEVIDYRGRLQLKISSIRQVTADDHVKIEDLIRTAPLQKDDMLAVINEFIFDIRNPNLQRLTRALIKKHEQAFLESPAATRNHHEFMSGLAYHVVSMLNLAKSIVNLYPDIDQDLLYAGVILHDLGKVRELSGAIDTTYTVEGTLIGHISIIAAEIAETAKELHIDGEEVVALQHLVLSHHGKGEWGSPKSPMIREAEVLHLIDQFDARITMMNDALVNIEPGQFSERVMALEQRRFYKPAFQKTPADIL
ncbi:3'-5' exoribonuclease YhaM [Bacillus sp. FSL W7-1360]